MAIPPNTAATVQHSPALTLVDGDRSSPLMALLVEDVGQGKLVGALVRAGSVSAETQLAILAADTTDTYPAIAIKPTAA